MIISKLSAVNFRNYKNLEISVDQMVNVFYGQNAQGKTNILESIFFGAFGLSHRTNQENNLLSFNNEQMMVCLNFSSQTGEHELRIKKLTDTLHRKKEIILDKVKITPKEHYGVLNVVIFSPEDLQFVKGEPSLRRRFLNMQIAQTSRRYWELLVKYNRVLQQRNKLLKQIKDGEISEDNLIPWDKEFIVLASEICKFRQPAIQKLQKIADSIHQTISNGENLTIHYVLKNMHSEIVDGLDDYIKFFQEGLDECRSADIARGSTNIGPHRDDLYLEVNGKGLKDYGSQGQQRSVALALKLSQLEYVYKEIGEYPVLLLDDVMSELDENRRKKILEFIDSKIQTFITVNDKNLIPEISGAVYRRIENGQVI